MVWLDLGSKNDLGKILNMVKKTNIDWVKTATATGPLVRTL